MSKDISAVVEDNQSPSGGSRSRSPSWSRINCTNNANSISPDRIARWSVQFAREPATAGRSRVNGTERQAPDRLAMRLWSTIAGLRESNNMPAKVAEVHPGIYEIFLPLPMRPTIINVYLIDCHGAWALIDTGMNTAGQLCHLEGCLRTGRDQHRRPGRADRNASSRRPFRHFGDASRKISNATTLLHEFEVERVNRMLTLGPPSASPEAREFFHHARLPDREVSDRRNAPGLDGHRYVQSVAAA